MATKHIIKPGESLLSIAYDAGFDTWKRVWDDPDNDKLREEREDAQTLLPGDELSVPEKQRHPEDPCPVDKLHRFRLTRPRAWLNLQMLDRAAEPVAGATYEVEVDGQTHVGETDEGGVISVEIHPSARCARLRLWKGDREPFFDAPVRIGHLDPVSSIPGTRGRLTNLGLEWVDDAEESSDTTPIPDSIALDNLDLEHAHKERRQP